MPREMSLIADHQPTHRCQIGQTAKGCSLPRHSYPSAPRFRIRKAGPSARDFLTVFPRATVRASSGSCGIELRSPCRRCGKLETPGLKRDERVAWLKLMPWRSAQARSQPVPKVFGWQSIRVLGKEAQKSLCGGVPREKLRPFEAALAQAASDLGFADLAQGGMELLYRARVYKQRSVAHHLRD